jgi:hypothetical protein
MRVSRTQVEFTEPEHRRLTALVVVLLATSCFASLFSVLFGTPNLVIAVAVSVLITGSVMGALYSQFHRGSCTNLTTI